MARVRTVEFLPEIFQTETNKQFLNATLDQLIQEPAFKKIQGFVGRKTGPGVNADDRYVVETDADRANYQLEPGVILTNQDSARIRDAITYPGINSALELEGAIVTRDDRLNTSDYYTWDPFVDLDKFVNFSQYYWLPGGPDAVDVFATAVPTQDNFVVTRANGAYTFSGRKGNNPALTLVRGGNYTFQVAQNDKETVNFRVSNDGTNSWIVDYKPNPTLKLVRGNTYVFTLVLKGAFPFYIKTAPTLGTTNQFNNGVTNNGAIEGTITFTVPETAPDLLYYVNPTVANLVGTIEIVDAEPGTGPGFWIQTNPGVNGRIPSTPNISSRDVLGVFNNGEDLGTVTFNVPDSTAQSFYYGLTTVGPVDLITNLKFNQINNVFVDQFLAEHGGIDGISSLNGKTLVFQTQQADPESGGWEVTSQFDPLLEQSSQNGLPGSYDTTLFDQTTPVLESSRYGIWQIRYETTSGGATYIRLVFVQNINNFEKFTVRSGTVYSSTQWYKNSSGLFEQIPLLTAILDTLYYQDGTDPEIFGRIKLIEQDSADTLDIDDIIGQKNYTSPNGVVFTNGLKVQFTGSVNPASYTGNSYYVEGVGTAIRLLPVTNFVTPETYTQSATVPYDSTPYDVGNFDASLNQPLIPDYITINRASSDLNPWSRSNRWFHIDVINASAEYNNTIPSPDNRLRAKRPIIEFRAGTKLFDFGTQGKQPVDVIDFRATDALSTINGATGYIVDGYSFINGSRVIFAADTDPQVRNKVYVVEFITPDTVPPLIAEPIINLVPADDSAVLINQTVVCLSGNTLQGKSFYYDGVEWIAAQDKIRTNQAPLFDVFDANGVSFGNRAVYPSTNFTGSKLFSYAIGNGVVDPVLGFAIKYLSLANVGDIVFDNNLYTDTFTYTKDSVSNTENISLGFVRQYLDRVIFTREIGWQPAVVKSQQRQQLQFVYDGRPLLLDVAAKSGLPIPAVQVFVANQYKEPSTYTYEVGADSTTITLDQTYAIGDTIEVLIISDQASKVGFYQVPVNLENNPLNVNSSRFTLGTVRAHYETIGQNLLSIVGPINGANNTRDLGNIIPYGTNILQQSSPLTLEGYFLRSAQYNVFNAIEFNSREYEKFKAKMLNTAISNDYTNYSIPEILNLVIADMNAGSTNLNPFYWSDMLAASSIYQQSETTVTPISTNVFDLSTTYDFTSSNYKSLLVYVNNELLTIGYDYEVSADSPTLTITRTLSVGDVVKIQEFATTYGTFVPNTPTKMGLYPAFRPQIYLDTNYVTPTLVILGHDGSKTVAFGDFRDQLLLEFETRIFNNLKIKSSVPLPETEVIPGRFRNTDYSLSEINQIFSSDFYSWVGWNKLDFQTQDYISSNEFTYNYSTAGDLLSNPTNTQAETPLAVGAWRGLYEYFYDTTSPNTTPWEMLGFSQEPDWWVDVYGAAPYTRNNLVLWDDLEAGRVADPAGEYILPQYARPGLTLVIPVDDQGNLLSPLDCIVGAYDSLQFQKSWVFGDGGPVEYTWRSSSSYPFAVMRLLALTRPAEFFSLFADRDLYKFDQELGQYLYNNRYRLDANGIEVYGLQANGQPLSKASYINWIVDYNQQLGINSTVALEADLSELDVRLCYRVGAFTDKQYTKIYAEKSSPDSLNSSLLLPDESYNLLLYKNQPFEQVTYSSVIVQRVQNGWAVFGYNTLNPYFNILVSNAAGQKITISSGGSAVTVPINYTNTVAQVPYGYVFTNQTVVVDFLLSYGALLESQGVIFDGRENGRPLNWNQMAQEFLYWANQGWAVNSVINLNPAASRLTATKPQAIVDSVVAQTPENVILDQNGSNIPIRDLVVNRENNTFQIFSLSSLSISYLNLKYTNYETMIVLDNVSIFNDLLYDPVTGARQSRVNIASYVSADWNGQLDAQGFILNNNANVQNWQPNRKYAKGEIVLYKNNYWSAQTIVQPSVEFRYSDWVKSDYTKIQGGLLENIPNKADQLANSYNTNTANLETDQDLLAYGLIGFRPRDYMTALNLDDVSQVNVYKQFLKDKGTIRSVRLLGNANLGKEVAEYDIYENWAIQRAVYGANANRSFIELRLNEADLDSNPSLVQVIEPDQISQADQKILLQDVWRESYKLTSTNILPTTLLSSDVDTALPSAGYVNLDDVDITVFSLLGNLQLAPGVLDTIGVGTTIWAAKSNSYDWNVYRCNSVPGSVSSISSNLDSTSRVRFTQPHGLSVGDIVIIRLVNATVDGIYRVLSVPDVTSIAIELSINNTITTAGIAYRLQTMRVAQASDVASLPYANELVPGARAWVDNNGNNVWTVLEKQSPFETKSVLPVNQPVINSGFGTSVAQSQNTLLALIGSPGYYNNTVEAYSNITAYVPGDRVQYQDRQYICIASTTGNLPTNAQYWLQSAQGAVYTYLNGESNQYSESFLLELATIGTAAYGRVVAIGNQQWSIAGAPDSNNLQGYAATIFRSNITSEFDQTQLLTAPDQDYGSGEFGYAVDISADERWMYVGAPGNNKVYAYSKVEIPQQQVIYTTVNNTLIYSFLNEIVIDTANPEQLSVTLNNAELQNNVEYSVVGNTIVLNSNPGSGQELIITRRTVKQIDQQTFLDVAQNSGSTSGTGARFTVDNVRGTYSVSLSASGSGYAVSDTLVINGSAVDVANSLPNVGGAGQNITITVTEVDVSGGIVNFTYTGSGISNNTIFPLSPYLYNVTDIYSFNVKVNGVLQRPHIDYDYEDAGDSTDRIITFLTVPPAGATITVSASTQWRPVSNPSTGQPIVISGGTMGARFGSSVSTTTDGRQVAIGAINDLADPTHPRAGAVYAVDRSVTRYIISNPSQLSYALPVGYNDPVAVTLNGTFLTNSAYYINGDFSVDSGNVVLNSDVQLNVGDILELESNIFKQIQKISANTPFDEADFGSSVDVCPNNCSLYIGAPLDGSVLIQAGSVQRNVNQAKVYGTITTANQYQTTAVAGATYNVSFVPGYYKAVDKDAYGYDYELVTTALTPGDTIRINNTVVAVPTVPNNTVTGFAQAIVSAAIPNVTAFANNGRLTISVVNVDAATAFNKLNVLPGTSGTVYSDLGFDLFAFTQTIVSPNPTINAKFGSSLMIDSEADNLIVGAPLGNLYEPMTFDEGTTYFDDRSTVFSDTVVQSGVVYSFDYLPAANETVNNPGKFVFGQQIYDNDIQPLDQFGQAVSYVNGRLIVGSPGNDLGDSSAAFGRVVQFNNSTRTPAWVAIHTQQPVVDIHLLNTVFMYDYSRLERNKTTFFDFINPLQGKILGAARQNIDYIIAVDPAMYNVGPLNNNGNYWAQDRVGQIWWNISTARFIDPNQDDIVYASRRWGQLFPGSTVDIYQWTESTVPPAQYSGPGTPFSTTSYVSTTRLNQQGIIATYYYFWVTGLDTINTGAGKTLSTTGIARYIESPRSSGIPYIAPINASTVAIYNGLEYIVAADTILHIGYDRELTDDNVHTEFELITVDRPDSFLSDNLYRKLQDSFCGVNSTGAKVPDPDLSPAEQYGVQFRPRQSMFADRFTALKNYLTRVNNILAQYPIVEIRSFNLLNSAEPEPTQASGEWNKRLATVEELGYQNINAVPLGYKYLVVSDSTNDGLWTIYTVVAGQGIGAPRQTLLTRVQNYDTRKYWFHIDWYRPGYNSRIVPVAEVPVYSSLITLSLTQAPVGSSVKVTANAQGKFEIYLRTELGWDRVGLEDGTIQFSNTLWDYLAGRFGFDVEVFDAQYFDAEPVIETRKIIQAINEELLIDDLALERNRCLILMFEFMLQEFQAPEWLTKTSLIDVEHKIRDLIPFQIYRQDNQDFVLQYIQEVKPYHVQIKEFNLTYDGQDSYPGMVTDFDNPAYYNFNLEIPQFVSPILLPYEKSTAVGTGTPSSIADTASDAEIWQLNPWKFWYNNYLLSIQEVNIIDGGSGYTEPPIVTVTGEADIPAQLEAVINSAGEVAAINVINPGAGYTTTATITISQGNGTGARAYAVMGNDLVRSMKTTIKYDRYQYQTTIVDWEPGVNYDNGTQVRYLDQVWQANSDDSSGVQGTSFDPDQWIRVDSGSLSGVDRTMGFYVATVNQPGLELPLLIDGIDYPGVQVYGPDFSQNTGFDVGNYDINPFDNIAFGPEGRPTYDPGILDAIYESYYGTPATGPIPTGNAATDINVEGGGYVDTYSSHAPEELVPGAEFDTLDLRVYTRPGADWALNGHGFRTEIIKYVYNPAIATYSFAGLEPFVAVISVTDQNTGLELSINNDYTVDWANQTISFVSGSIGSGSVFVISTFELGGGNQLFRQAYNGSEVGNSLVIPVTGTIPAIQEIAIFVNGIQVTDFTYAPSANNTTTITFGSTYDSADYVAVYVIAPTTVDSTTVNYSWSTPITQLIVADGSSLAFELDNNLSYTNPVNAIVTVDGARARTAAGAEYIADGSTAFLLPGRLGFSQSLISENEVIVYVDNVLQTLYVDYFVEPFDVEGEREVIFATAPATGSQVQVYVTSFVQARISSGLVIFNAAGGLIPTAGQVIAVTTWNDTRQQNLLTKVFVGPVTEGVTVNQPYDSTDFDSPVSGDPFETDPGLFDFTDGVVVEANNLQLGRVITDPSRLWVSLNTNTTGGGRRLFFGDDFILNGEELILHRGILGSTDTVMVTMVTDSVVPNAMAFRIFQDMRGVQATYRITPETTTTLVQELGANDDIIYVADASALSEPEVEKNIWGVITIDGERIMYRERNTTTNTVSSLMRGTAGTARASHAVGAEVYDLGRGNLMPEQFQNYVVKATFAGNGSTTTFVASDINNTGVSNSAVEVYVGGLRVTSGYTVSSSNPVTVVFATAPADGYQVDILVRRGVTWYAPGAGTASDGVALQDTNTQAARFLRGL